MNLRARLDRLEKCSPAAPTYEERLLAHLLGHEVPHDEAYARRLREIMGIEEGGLKGEEDTSSPT